MEKKKNCWEFHNCNKHVPDRQTNKVPCPAVTHWKLDGVNGGVNAGRVCWVVAGTFCDGEVQGNLARKLSTCQLCKFFSLVREEEGDKFVLIPSINSIR